MWEPQPQKAPAWPPPSEAEARSRLLNEEPEERERKSATAQITTWELPPSATRQTARQWSPAQIGNQNLAGLASTLMARGRLYSANHGTTELISSLNCAKPLVCLAPSWIRQSHLKANWRKSSADIGPSRMQKRRRGSRRCPRPRGNLQWESAPNTLVQ